MWNLTVPESLRIPSYRRLIVASLISNTGGWGQSVVIGMVAYHGHSWWGLFIGAVVPVALPRAIMGSWSGKIADHFPRRKVISYTLSLQMIIASTFWMLKAMGSHLYLWEMFGLLTISNTSNNVFNNARQALVKEMVPSALYRNALSVNTLQINVGKILGSTLGGLLSAPDKQYWLFLGNALSYLPVIYTVHRMDFGRERPVRTGEKVRMRKALKYVARERTARRALIVYFIIAVCANGSLANQLIGYEHGGPRAYTLIVTTSGVGSLCASFVQSLLKERREPTLPGLLSWAALMSLLIALYSASPWLPTAMAFLTMSFVCGNVYEVASNTVIVGRAPGEMSGRVSAIYVTVYQYGTLVSGLITCLALDHVGAGVRVVITGINVIGLAMICAWRALQFRGIKLALSSSCLLWVLHTPGLRRERQL